MVSTRKAVRDAIIAILAAPLTGFNAGLAAVASSYGVTPFTIDWSAGSKQLFQGYLLPDQIELSQVIVYPACVAYTTFTQNQNLEKFRRFSGIVTLNLDFYVDFRTGIEVDQTDDLPDAIEDAITGIINQPLLNLPSNIAWNGGIECAREPVRLLQDGWFQRCPHQLIFEVDV